jgi:hypothetical protein
MTSATVCQHSMQALQSSHTLHVPPSCLISDKAAAEVPDPETQAPNKTVNLVMHYI